MEPFIVMSARGKPAKEDGAIGRPDANPSGNAVDAGFDRWIRRQLHQMYDPVLGESLPDELADLLAKFDERPDPNKPPKEG